MIARAAIVHRAIRKCAAHSLIGILCLLAAGAIGSQPPATGSSDRGLFWKVEKDGATSYLLGTVHVWKREWLPLNPAIEKAFGEASTLAVELDSAKMDMAGAVQKMMLGGNETLEARLGKPLYERTRAETARLGLPDTAVNQLKPWGVMLVLAATRLQQLGYSPDSGLDNYLLRKARASGKQIVELESGDQQLAVMDGLSPRLQNAMLADVIANMDRTPQVIGDIVTAWKNGDLASTFASSQKSLDDAEARREFEDRFLYQRDVIMARKIEALLRQPGSHFIAVGALHLVGPRSIVEQLKARGYRVEQI